MFSGTAEKDENSGNTEQKFASSGNGGEQNDGFVLEIEEADESEEGAIVVKDVSDMVESARQSVVGIVTESFSEIASTSSGSGIIMSEDGYILTNYHVIEDGDSIMVNLDDGTSYQAYVIGNDEYTDIAVLKIEASGLSAASFGNSDQVKVGQAAIAIGNPTGQLQGTVTAGIISAVNRGVVVNNNVINLIQTDAAINSGNSGGPLLNQYGQVIGVNSVKVTLSGYEGLGFAIPINTVKPIVEQLIAQGYVSDRPLVGIAGQEISQMASLFYNLPQGIFVNSINQESDAYEQGIREGDVIIEVGGERVKTLSQACLERNTYTAGDTISLTIYRNQETISLEVELMEQTGEESSYNF